MKLLMISGDRSILAGKRGAFWYTLEELSRHFERIDVVCSRAPTPSPIGGGEKGWGRNVYFHPSLSGLWYQPFWIKKMGMKLIGEYGHEVMTVHDYPPFYNGFGARKLKKEIKIPACLEIHHIVGWPVPASFTERLGYWLTKLIIKGHVARFESVRTVSAGNKDQLIRLGVPAEKIQIVPSFYLDLEILKPRSVQKKYDLVFCGRIVKNKGLNILIEALKDLPGRQLLVIGDGPESKNCVLSASRLGITGQVDFVGWLPDQKSVVEALESAKIFVLPSLSEGGPRIALEAMALGLPVVATRVGVLPEVIEDGLNGVFFDGTSDDLKLKIEKLLGDPAKIHSIGAQASEITKKFDRKKLIAAYADYLKSLKQA